MGASSSAAWPVARAAVLPRGVLVVCGGGAVRRVLVVCGGVPHNTPTAHH
ncbi:hypothetical protein ACFYUY_09990 [Kitasatospora sp. NPDC004745]